VVKRQRARRVPPARCPPGIPRCFAPHQLRHAHAVELAREGVPLNIIQRQLGHAKMDALGRHGGAKTPLVDRPI
jgi:site-specific recombinase XerD